MLLAGEEVLVVDRIAAQVEDPSRLRNKNSSRIIFPSSTYYFIHLPTNHHDYALF
jgi:hypothetical protein